MKSFVAAALLSAAFIAGPAYAQTAQTAQPAAPAASSTDSAGTKMMLKGKWRASKLMGLDVYNDANEKLGDVNELIRGQGWQGQCRGDRRRRLPRHGRA